MPDHDHSYKQLFSQVEIVRDLLTDFVPSDWLPHLRLETLEPWKTSFVAENNEERRNDVIWRVRFTEDQWLFIYILIEFQSKSDRLMALRIMVYMGLLYQELVKSGQVKFGELLPPILPIVIYNGSAKWTASIQMADLISPTPKGFEKFRPQLEYYLLDEQREDESSAFNKKNLVAAIIALEKTKNKENFRELTSLMTDWIKEPEQTNIRRAFFVWIKRTILAKKQTDYKICENLDNLSEVNPMLSDNVQLWIHEWLAEGETKGEAKGEARGEVRAIVKMAEEGDIDLQKARKKIASFRFQLQDENFWTEIDNRLEKLTELKKKSD
jgi:predicted transposase/invertase (TIGR01784 family)